jgi:hypothetical protein
VGSPTWPVHVITPTAHPLEALATSLTRDSQSVTATATLMDDLARDPRSLHLYVRRLLSQHAEEAGNNKENQNFILVIDQFEELFTLCRDQTERWRFVGNLLTAAGVSPDGSEESSEKNRAELIRSPSPRSSVEHVTIVIITLRADFYAHCAQHEHLRQALAQHQEYIGPMNGEDCVERLKDRPSRGAGLSSRGWLICSCKMWAMSQERYRYYPTPYWRHGNGGADVC